METQGMELDVFAKQKVTEDGRSALQVNICHRLAQDLIIIAVDRSWRPPWVPQSNISRTRMASTCPAAASSPSRTAQTSYSSRAISILLKMVALSSASKGCLALRLLSNSVTTLKRFSFSQVVTRSCNWLNPPCPDRAIPETASIYPSNVGARPSHSDGWRVLRAKRNLAGNRN